MQKDRTISERSGIGTWSTTGGDGETDTEMEPTRTNNQRNRTDGQSAAEAQWEAGIFHASLVDWLKDPSRSGTHCVDDSGIYELADFLWRDRETATRDLLLGQDQFTELWVERSAWTKQIIVQGYSPRYWLNMSQNEAKELAKNTHALDKEIEYARRLVSLAYEAWGGGHDIFELAKAEWEELRDRLQQ